MFYHQCGEELHEEGQVPHTSARHHKYGGRIFLSLLLFICFAAGILLSVRCGHGAYNALNTPYREQERAALESVLSVIDSGAARLLRYQETREENRAAADSLSAGLSGLKAQQAEEILEAVYHSDRFDLDDFFHRNLFSQAYQDYLQELLDAFKSDKLLDSWLYSYYETTGEYGGNDFLDTDMWIYQGGVQNKFSSNLDSAASLMREQYSLDLYEHMLYMGRIYITGSDFMREILSLPRYIMDGAVFAKAFGGAELYVPGWDGNRYEEFWLYGANYYNIDTPMWLGQGFRAENFDLDWNALVNEAAFYEAYRNFMDKIAPGLPCYEMASYHADNMAYGGMGCDVKGQEASFRDIFAAYAENHPEFLDELMGNKHYARILATSVDQEIAEAETRLEQLENEFLDLQEQERELMQILGDADIYRGRYALLLTDTEQHRQRLTTFLLFLSGTALLSALAALICLCKFFGFLKRPPQNRLQPDTPVPPEQADGAGQ